MGGGRGWDFLGFLVGFGWGLERLGEGVRFGRRGVGWGERRVGRQVFMRAWGYGRNYLWRVCEAVLWARWHCYWYRGLMDDGGRGWVGGGEGREARGFDVEDVYVHAALSEEGMENWILRT